MEFCLNAPVSGFLPETSPEYVIAPACSNLGGSVNELFPHLGTEEEVSLEWLSIFVEDCLSSTGNYVPATPHHHSCTAVTKSFKPMLFNTKFAIPVKPRSKRRRPTSPKTHENPLISWSKFRYVNPKENPTLHFTCSDPPLLQQSQWLADSELIILPRNEGSCRINGEGEESSKEEENKKTKRKKMEELGKDSSGGGAVQGVQVRRCSHCQAQKTPQWRAGPLGPKTLCNACGVRFKSGRLFPEYRPAKSPTFVSCMHSNSHKKVLEMRMALLSSSSPNQH
ncbi:hypothetical protein Ancab_013678 [Ancistrocladus abbreviatus]